MELLGQIVKGDFVGTANFRGELIGLVAVLPVHFGQKQRSPNRILYLFKGLGMGGLFIEDFYDVKAVLGLNDVRNFALFQAKSGLLELSDGLTLANPAEIAAFVFRTWVFRIFLGEILEFGTALLGLLQDVFSLLADFRHFGVSLVIGQKQDVFDMNTV